MNYGKVYKVEKFQNDHTQTTDVHSHGRVKAWLMWFLFEDQRITSSEHYYNMLYKKGNPAVLEKRPD